MIVDSMSKREVMGYIRKEYNSTVTSHFLSHLKQKNMSRDSPLTYRILRNTKEQVKRPLM